MADVLTGSVPNGVVVLDAILGRPSLPVGTRVRVAVAELLPGSSLEPDPLPRTRVFLLAAARDAEAQAPPRTRPHPSPR